MGVYLGGGSPRIKLKGRGWGVTINVMLKANRSYLTKMGVHLGGETP